MNIKTKGEIQMWFTVELSELQQIDKFNQDDDQLRKVTYFLAGSIDKKYYRFDSHKSGWNKSNTELNILMAISMEEFTSQWIDDRKRELSERIDQFINHNETIKYKDGKLVLDK